MAGDGGGWAEVQGELERFEKQGKVELLGRVSDERLYELYAKAKGFLALERDVDFGMTPVEAMAAGTPVVALNGAGYRETVIEGKTGILIEGTDEKSLEEGIKRFRKMKWKKQELQKWAGQFSRDNFEKGMKRAVKEVI
jgi:glycosyltransferase involved in cell wall biosynthesis